MCIYPAPAIPFLTTSPRETTEIRTAERMLTDGMLGEAFPPFLLAISASDSGKTRLYHFYDDGSGEGPKPPP